MWERKALESLKPVFEDRLSHNMKSILNNISSYLVRDCTLTESVVGDFHADLFDYTDFGEGITDDAALQQHPTQNLYPLLTHMYLPDTFELFDNSNVTMINRNHILVRLYYDREYWYFVIGLDNPDHIVGRGLVHRSWGLVVTKDLKWTILNSRSVFHIKKLEMYIPKSDNVNVIQSYYKGVVVMKNNDLVYIDLSTPSTSSTEICISKKALMFILWTAPSLDGQTFLIVLEDKCIVWYKDTNFSQPYFCEEHHCDLKNYEQWFGQENHCYHWKDISLAHESSFLMSLNDNASYLLLATADGLLVHDCTHIVNGNFDAYKAIQYNRHFVDAGLRRNDNIPVYDSIKLSKHYIILLEKSIDKCDGFEATMISLHDLATVHVLHKVQAVEFMDDNSYDTILYIQHNKVNFYNLRHNFHDTMVSSGAIGASGTETLVHSRGIVEYRCNNLLRFHKLAFTK